MPQTLQEAQDALEALSASDKLLEAGLAELGDATAQEKSTIEEIIKSGALTDSAISEVESTEAAEADATALTDEMVESLRLVLSELRAAASEVQAASIANQ